MSEVKRYDHYDPCGFIDADKGDWVTSEDYDALAHELSLSEAMCESLGESAVMVQPLREEVADLRGQLAEMTEYLNNLLKHMERLASKSFDARQQLAASQAQNFSLNSASSLQVALRREDQATITRLEAQLAARDKRLVKAVSVIANTRRSLEKAKECGAVICTIWLDSPCPETLFDYLDTFLATIEQDKANDH